MKVAVVGATGLVGREMIKVLEERAFPFTELIPVASERSVGTEVIIGGKGKKVVAMKDAISMKPELALFSAGGAASLEWAPQFAEAGIRVVDNSSAWRMDKSIKLIVPEINANTIERKDMIIANPNCSTIQLVLALAPLHAAFTIKRVVVSTYQSITGTGKGAVEQMASERSGNAVKMVYPWTIDQNCLPHCDVFLENGYTREEMKMVNETHKILDPNIKVTATAVRVPVVGGHSESINLEFENDFSINEVHSLLGKQDGIVVLDDIENNIYPMPVQAAGKDEVFVGRIRRDNSRDKALNLWVVADNLRKGAATNAVQIAEYLIPFL